MAYGLVASGAALDVCVECGWAMTMHADGVCESCRHGGQREGRDFPVVDAIDFHEKHDSSRLSILRDIYGDDLERAAS